jgi:unsaturated chondroitin disaccharide hydrolase
MSLLSKVEQRWTNINLKDSDKLFQKTLDQVLERTERNIKRFGNGFPYYGKVREYILTDNDNWVTGYWTAWLWMAYYQTDDKVFKEAADRHFEGYNWRFNKTSIQNHGAGVIYDMAAVRGFAVTGEAKWKQIGLRAAAFLTTCVRSLLPQRKQVGDE